MIVQGRYDVVCPMESAWALHRAWPEAEFIITPDSGHSAFDPPNSRALVAATDKFAGLVTSFSGERMPVGNYLGGANSRDKEVPKAQWR